MRAQNPAFSLLLKYVRRHRSKTLLLTLAYLASTALFILAPQALSRFIDSASGGGLLLPTLLAISLYLAAVLARTALSAVLNVQLASVGQLITDDHRRDVMEHFLSLSSQNLSQWTSGEAITRLDEDVQGLFQYYYILFYKLAASGLALAAILAVLALRSGWLSAALLVASLLSILGLKAIQDRGIPKYVRHSAASAAFNGQMKEMLDNSAELRALNAGHFADGRMKQAMRHRYRESFPASLMYGNLWSAATIMKAAVVGLGLLFSLLLWDAGLITLGTAYLIYTYSEMVIEPLQDFRNHMGNLQQAKAGILRTQELLDTPAADAQGALHLADEPLSVCVDGLSFAYEGGSAVLKDLHLSLPAGRRLGIMGETGCGKSTLLSLIAGLNRCPSGTIRISGIALGEIHPESLRQRVAYCTQRVQLLHGTLRENIAFFDARHTDGDILKAIGQLGLLDWFQKFPEGLDTRLALREGNLSSGEAQLISLIRLALKRPQLVLLDEITANLDAATERQVTRAMKALCEGRTVIAIAHKAEALRWMDEIIKMDQGVLLAPQKGGVA